MKFMLIFSIKPEGAKRDEAIARFQKIGGMLPKGLRFWDAGHESISAAVLIC
jgi:hypothetical protein